MQDTKDRIPYICWSINSPILVTHSKAIKKILESLLVVKMFDTIKGLESKPLNGENLKILIVHTRWNTQIVSRLVKGCKETLEALGATVTLWDVPGAFELPFACQKLLLTGLYDACIPIGVLIKGSTMHFEYIAEATSHGIMRVGLDTKLPVVFGVLTCLTETQAMERCGHEDVPKSHNHGIDWAHCAIEMANLNKS